MVYLPGGRIRDRPAIPRTARVRGDGPTRREDFAVFGISFVLFLIAAVFFFYVLDVFNRDALSRSVDAHNVLYSRDPHLGAIGLVWPPIPTMMRVALLQLTSPFGLAEFTGPITSVIAAAGCVVLFNRILTRFTLSKNTRIVWIAASIANPVTLYHLVNGTAEAAFAFAFLAVILASLQLRARPERAVLGMGIAGGLAFWVRYEAVAIMGMAVVGFGLMAYAYRRDPAWRSRPRLESLLVALAFPGIFLGGLWLSFNYTAEGDALFFYRGPFSINAAPDVAKNAVDHALRYAYHSPVGTVRYVVERTFQLSFLFPIAVLGVFWVSLKRREMDGTVLALLAVSTLALQAYQTYTGTIAPWLRYWIYLPILTPILLAWLARQYPMLLRAHGHVVWIRMALIPMLFLLGNALSYGAMGREEVSPDEQLVVYEIAGDEERVESLRTTSNFPDRDVVHQMIPVLESTEGTILVDVQEASVLILEFHETDRLIINTDRQFDSVLEQPIGQTDWILLPDPAAKGAELSRDAIYTRYPTLYDGAPWLELAQEFDGEMVDWRLYRVLGDEAAAR
jgi:hypothetical protein